MKADGRAVQVDKLFSQWAKADSPGCAVGILQDGEVVYAQGYGMANLEYDIPITPETIFHVASVSKQFAAAAVALLEADGLLSVQDDVRKYVPELYDFGATITIAHLIHHTSGLRDQWELLISAGWRLEDVITTEDILDLVFQQRELNFQPGAEYAYCNTGYTLLGVIVERVSGKSLRQFCAERIFAPLGMTRTHFHDDYQELVTDRAYSYEAGEDGVLRHAHLLYGTVGATSLFTTVGDLLRWEQNFFVPRIGDAAFLARMVERGVLNDGEPISYAFGLVVRTYRGLKTVDHSGGDAGYRTHVVHFPDQRFAVAVFSNLASVAPGVLALKIADIYLGEQMQPDTEPTMPMSEARLRALAGSYYSATRRETLHLPYADGALRLWGLALQALDQQHFRAAEAPSTRVTFASVPDAPLQVTLNSGIGRAATYERVQLIVADNLSDYIGTYTSAELGASYRVGIQNGTLSVRRRKYPALPLTAIHADIFISEPFGRVFVFTRGADGQVSGFRMSSVRVRDLAFVREP